MSRKKEVSRKCELGTFPLSGLEPINQGYTERSFEKEEEVEIVNWIQLRLSPIKAQTRR